MSAAWLPAQKEESRQTEEKEEFTWMKAIRSVHLIISWHLNSTRQTGERFFYFLDPKGAKWKLWADTFILLLVVVVVVSQSMGGR